MSKLARLAARLGQDTTGSMVIETAIVAPVLVLMSIGAFQTSQIIARQTELETAASEAEAIALSSVPDTAAKRTTIHDILMSSTGLATDKVTITEVYRCGSATSYITSTATCTSGVLSKYVKINLTDTYTPAWSKIGIKKALSFNVTRYVLYKQQTVGS